MIIDFWMLWLFWNSSAGDSSEFVFTSHFYFSLIEEKKGMEYVSSWVLQRNDSNLFDKCIIYFPINLDKHWSLCVAYNPSKVQDMVYSNCHCTTEGEIPVIIHIDSLSLHN